jgi:hypothetical protein
MQFGHSSYTSLPHPARECCHFLYQASAQVAAAMMANMRPKFYQSFVSCFFDAFYRKVVVVLAEKTLSFY